MTHEGEQLANCEAPFNSSQPVSHPCGATGWVQPLWTLVFPPFKDSQGDLLAGDRVLCSASDKSKQPISRREGCKPRLLSAGSPKSDPGSKCFSPGLSKG